MTNRGDVGNDPGPDVSSPKLFGARKRADAVAGADRELLCTLRVLSERVLVVVNSLLVLRPGHPDTSGEGRRRVLPEVVEPVLAVAALVEADGRVSGRDVLRWRS